MTRSYPEFEIFDTPLTRQISFVTVQFCDELQHNLLTSPAVNDPNNQLVIVDNRQNMFFNNLSQAMINGIQQAKHDLIIVIHEDVVLREGWQHQFEQSLDALEQHDPNWGVVGAAGSWENRQAVCHVSDPHSYRNTLNGAPFHEVYRLDEHMFAFRRSNMIDFDPDLPSIHNIGRDMLHQLNQRGQKGYVVDAATIHKYADGNGELIQNVTQSPKIVDRKQRTYLADLSCCDDYYLNKWNLAEPAQPPLAPTKLQSDILDRPVILLGRGGGGTRILSCLAQDCDLFVGNDVNLSGDCMDMVHTMYRAVCTKFLSSVDWQLVNVVPEIRNTAAQMQQMAGWPNEWGFKLPESLLLLPELEQAFPNARYVHFKRDPMGTVLRRSHMTARLDNHIGRVCVRAAYDYFDLDREQALIDDDITRMVVTTAHQLDLVEAHKSRIPQDRWLDLSFEDAIANPQTELGRLSNFLGVSAVGHKTQSFVNPARSAKGPANINPETQAHAAELFARLERRH